MQNPFIWYDLMTADLARAEKFYSSVLGWTYTDQPPAYRIANVNGLGIGGLMAMPDEIKGQGQSWDGYIFTPDVDASAKHCVELGGTICKAPWNIPGILRMAVLADPSGAKFNIMQPLMEGPQETPEPGSQGTIGWQELNGGDVEKDFAFYHAMFGWTKGIVMPMGETGEMGDYQVFQIAGQDAGGMMRRFPSMPHAHWEYYFCVNGIDEGIARILHAGGKILMGPVPVPGDAWVVNAQDDQGAHFSLLSQTK